MQNSKAVVQNCRILLWERDAVLLGLPLQDLSILDHLLLWIAPVPYLAFSYHIHL